MNKKRYRIGLISASPLIIDHSLTYCSEHNIDLRVSETLLHDAIGPAKKMESDGIEVVLTGHGTGGLLRKWLQIPIVTFGRDPIDFIKGLLKLVENGKQKILVPLYNTSIQDADVLERFFGIDIKCISYKDVTELENIIQNASANGFDATIGGGMTVKYALKNSLFTIEIGWDGASALAALETAVSVIKTQRKEQEKTERYECILNATSEGIIASDRGGMITSINSVAAQLLTLDKKENIIGKSINACLPKKLTARVAQVISDSTPIYDSLEKVNRKSIVCNLHPIFVEGLTSGCVTSFSTTSNLIKTENKVRRSLAKGHTARYTIEDLLYESQVMHDVVSKSIRFAKIDSNLVISGETGTGKEILAQSIHNLSKRAKQPFVSLNCAALPDHLLESELFGYDEGAFTGSRKGGKPGLFEIAHKGTIFLDEIGETTENVQIRLLRVLQEREIMRLGGEQLVPIDVRVIVASNKDLGKEVHKGRFREDLFFRLNVLRIHLPPLRKRLVDIPILIHVFINELSKQWRSNPIVIPDDCLEKLMNYRWPGNVRQLRNFAECILLLSPRGFQLDEFETLCSELMEYEQQIIRPEEKKNESENLYDQLKRKKKSKEVDELKKALEQAKYSKTKAAKILGISRTTLWKRLKQTELF